MLPDASIKLYHAVPICSNTFSEEQLMFFTGASCTETHNQ